MRVPTKRFIEEAQKAKLVKAGLVIGMSIYRACPGYSQSFVVDIREHNVKATRGRGKKYCLAQVGKARDGFLTLPFITTVRKWSAFVYTIAIQPFDGLKQIQKSFAEVKTFESGKNRQKLDTESNRASCNWKNAYEQQQHIKAIHGLIAKSGFNFKPEVVTNLALKYSAIAIALAIRYVKAKMCGRKPIHSPEGYVINCLELGYWSELDYKGSEDDFYSQVLQGFRTASSIIKEQVTQYKGELPQELENQWNQLQRGIELSYYQEDLISVALADADRSLAQFRKERKTRT